MILKSRQFHFPGYAMPQEKAKFTVILPYHPSIHPFIGSGTHTIHEQPWISSFLD
jgi:hypothetical protein